MAQSSLPNRILLPTPILFRADVDSLNTRGGSGPPNKEHEPKQKRLQVSIACEVCRLRKTKCDGMRPTCTPCQTRRLHCHYFADPDTTRKMTLERKYQALTNRNYVLESLLDFLRDAPPLDASAALEQIRTGFSAEEVLQTVLHNGLATAILRDRPDSEPISLSPADSATLPPSAGAELPRSRSTSSVRDRMNINAVLATDSSSDTSPERQELCPLPIPLRRRSSDPYLGLRNGDNQG